MFHFDKHARNTHLAGAFRFMTFQDNHRFSRSTNVKGSCVTYQLRNDIYDCYDVVYRQIRVQDT